MNRKIGALIPVFFLIANFLIPTKSLAANSFGPLDVSIPGISQLTLCKTASELDCIESFGVYDTNGQVIIAKHLEDISYGTYTDENGNTVVNGETKWSVIGSGLNLEAKLRVGLETPNKIIWKNDGGINQYGASLRVMVFVSDPKNTKINLVVRTSWLKPMNVQLKALESDFKQEKISGGNRFTFIGKGMPFSDYTGDWLSDPNKKNYSAKADLDSYLLQFYVHHAGIDAMHSYWPPICADVGYSVQSHNTNSTGDPSWDPKTNSLNFAIQAPHLTASGQLNTGYFQYKVSNKFIDCKYPTNNLTKAKYLKLEVIDQDGTRQVATTSVVNSNGEMVLTATGFHFSAPQIVVTAEDPIVVPAPVATPAPTPTPASKPTSTPSISPSPASKTIVKSKTITCIKGKLIKKVTALNPKCPVGYKLK